MFGILNVTKPPHLTSRDVVNRVCKKLQTRQVGHAGTLDPMATGVLLLAVGPATRLVNFLHEFPKTYRGKFKLGVDSTTEDSYGELTDYPDAPKVTREQFHETLPNFIGDIDQVPPRFSAIKVQGKRAYRLARKGVAVELKTRTISIHDLKLTEFSYPEFGLEIQCGTGTYVRSLGRDLAKSLETHAIMTSLVRTSIGHFNIEDAMTLEEFESSEHEFLSPLECVKHYPRVVVTQQQLDVLIDGAFIDQDYIADQVEISRETDTVVAVDKDEHLIAVLKRFDANKFKPKINFCKYWVKPS